MSSLQKGSVSPQDSASAPRGPLASAPVALAALVARRLGRDDPARADRYAAFISYSHRDSATARWLHKAIETFRMPAELVGTPGEFGPVPARLRPVFRDEDELAGAAELGPKLEGALARSNALIVICSPASATSRWVDKEIRTFKRLNPGAPVLPVIARGSPEVAFPESLCFALDEAGEIDRAHPLEPLAPDLGKHDRRIVKLKLIAGLAGVGFAALERRDLRRRRQISAALAAAALVIIALLSALSIAAFSYARIAVRERNQAIAARNQAIAARELAEKRTWLAQQVADQIRGFAADAHCHPK